MDELINMCDNMHMEDWKVDSNGYKLEEIEEEPKYQDIYSMFRNNHEFFQLMDNVITIKISSSYYPVDKSEERYQRYLNSVLDWGDCLHIKNMIEYFIATDDPYEKYPLMCDIDDIIMNEIDGYSDHRYIKLLNRIY